MTLDRMIPVTDEQTVTADTRFWLWFEVRSHSYRWTDAGRLEVVSRPRHRIDVEVSEATYRRAYVETLGLASDVTHPLDDGWWTDRPYGGGYPSPWEVRTTRGGRIDWWSPR